MYWPVVRDPFALNAQLKSYSQEKKLKIFKGFCLKFSEQDDFSKNIILILTLFC